jgi:hypothetical protein
MKGGEKMAKTKARSAVTGKYVAKSYAKSHPKTTVNERAKSGSKKK